MLNSFLLARLYKGLLESKRDLLTKFLCLPLVLLYVTRYFQGISVIFPSVGYLDSFSRKRIKVKKSKQMRKEVCLTLTVNQKIVEEVEKILGWVRQSKNGLFGPSVVILFIYEYEAS